MLEYRSRRREIARHEDCVAADVVDDRSKGRHGVTITTSDVGPVLEILYPIEKADGRYVEWAYLGEPRVANSTLVDTETYPTLDGMMFAAKDILRMIKSGYNPDSANPTVPHDTWGCDSIFRDLQCTSNGNCCDVHDLCYTAYDCTYWSWIGISNPGCIGCNALVTSCYLYGVGNTGQPSECCALGNCGRQRCPGIYSWNPNCTPIWGDTPPGGPLDLVQDSSGGGGGGGWSSVPDGSTSVFCSRDGINYFACKG